MPSAVLATLANDGWLDQARQVFSGAYWQAAWPGDLLLVAYDTTEARTRWFTDRGIRVHHVGPDAPGADQIGVLAGKFALFEPWVQEWGTVVYLDADTIVRGQLDGLIGLPGFSAVQDLAAVLWGHLERVRGGSARGPAARARRRLVREATRSHGWRSRAFNAGMFAFDTSLAGLGTAERLRSATETFAPVARFADQLPLNVVMAGRWQPLPSIYNLQLMGGMHPMVGREPVDTLVLHTLGPVKAWDPKSPYLAEWQASLARADALDLTRRPRPDGPSAADLARSVDALERQAAESYARQARPARRARIRLADTLRPALPPVVRRPLQWCWHRIWRRLDKLAAKGG